MQTRSIKPGDIVHCNVRAQEFYARVTKGLHQQGNSNRKGVLIEPLMFGKFLPAHFVTAHQIIGHYTKRKGSH